MNPTHSPTRRARFCVPMVIAAARNSVPYAIVLVALIGGCASADRSPVATAGQGEAVIVCELKSPGTASAVIPAANELSKLPGVIDVSAAESHHTSQATNGKITPNTDAERVIFVVTMKALNGNAVVARTLPFWNQVLINGGYMDKIAHVDVFDGTLRNYLVSESFTQETTAADLQRRAAAIKEQNELRNRTK